MKIISQKAKFRLFACVILSFLNMEVTAQTNRPLRSEWVGVDSKGMLTYKALPTGDKIMDFSHAGYMGGGVIIPSPAVMVCNVSFCLNCIFREEESPNNN